MPDYPTLIPKTSTPTPETLPGGGIQLPALFSPDSATAQRVPPPSRCSRTPALSACTPPRKIKTISARAHRSRQSG